MHGQATRTLCRDRPLVGSQARLGRFRELGGAGLRRQEIPSIVLPRSCSCYCRFIASTVVAVPGAFGRSKCLRRNFPHILCSPDQGFGIAGTLDLLCYTVRALWSCLVAFDVLMSMWLDSAVFGIAAEHTFFLHELHPPGHDHQLTIQNV